MKYFLSILCLLPFLGMSQLNMTQLGHYAVQDSHSVSLNDIWGYVDGSGNEYALIGTTDGVSIVDVTTPSSPVEVFWKSGLNSVWRDLKTWNNHAYVTTEAPEGLLILDLSSLPNASGIDTMHWYGTPGNELLSAHNLYIDSSGYCYIFGSNLDNGGVRILDLNTDPENPTEVGFFENWYVHDGVVYADTMFLGHINDGFLSMVDVTDRTNPVYLGSTNTPSNFTHNVWTSDDRKYAYTTDEVSNAYIAAYDVSDPLNIIELDKVQSSPGENVIPHNTHFINEYLVTSYYRDGVTIHDVSNPSNIIEVGYFDSSPFTGSGFEGCWGAYPWLPSGNIIISDRQTGLFILGANYTRGCYLEGQVTDQVTTGPIPNATAKILAPTQVEYTNLAGQYEAGIGVPGAYDVAFYKPGYFPDTAFNVNLTSGNVVVQNMALVPKIPFTMVVKLEEQGSGNPIEGGAVHMYNQDFNFELTTDANGCVIIPGFYEDYYDLVVGKWGKIGQCAPLDYYDSVNDTVIMVLEDGYQDNFSLDLGWDTTATAATGAFVRDIPLGTGAFPNISNPDKDAEFDCGEYCYMTGNGGMNGDFDDVDYGAAELFSPKMDLSTYTNPYINYADWFFTQYGPYPLDDTAFVSLEMDGFGTVVIDSMYEGKPESQWVDKAFRVLDFLPNLSDSIRLNVYVSDLDTLVNVTEYAIDRFLVSEGVVSSVDKVGHSVFSLYPNPTEGIINIDLGSTGRASYRIYNAQGRFIESGVVRNNEPIHTFQYSKGLYFIRLTDGMYNQTLRFIKI